MADPDGTRARLEQELADVREQRQRMAAELEGEDSADSDVSDRGDEAVALEGRDDLARTDRRIEELERLLADPDSWADPAGLADGTVVTLRFADGAEETLRFVALNVGEPDGADVVTASSPLGQALAGRSGGDTITWAGPDGDLQAEVLSIEAP